MGLSYRWKALQVTYSISTFRENKALLQISIFTVALDASSNHLVVQQGRSAYFVAAIGNGSAVTDAQFAGKTS